MKTSTMGTSSIFFILRGLSNISNNTTSKGFCQLNDPKELCKDFVVRKRTEEINQLAQDNSENQVIAMRLLNVLFM